MKIPISISIDKETVADIDGSRGLIPRSRVIERAVDLGIEQLKKDPTLLSSVHQAQEPLRNARNHRSH